MLLDYVDDLLLDHGLTVVRPAKGVAGRTISPARVDDAEVPTFALLRAELGLPRRDPRWWPTGGRHLAVVHDLPEVEVSHPTLELLERTLAGLRAWDSARV